MKNIVQILLLCAVLPTFAAPRGEETLEERKKRITRKYVRETGTISQGQEFVPSDLPSEDARVAESEKFSKVDSAFKAEDRMSMGAPSPRPRGIPRATNNNWLLGDAEKEADPSSSPYDDLMNPSAEPEADDRRDYWSSRRGEATRRTRSWFGQGGDGRYSSGGFADPRAPVNSGAPRDSIYGRTGLFGDTRAPYTSPFSGGLGTTDGRGTYGAPIAPTDSSTGGPATERPTYGIGSRRGYQPYKSPYEIQREQRSQQWGETLRRNEQETPYQKPNSYQQWKQRNQGQSWDPTSDDAYLREVMPSGSRR